VFEIHNSRSDRCTLKFILKSHASTLIPEIHRRSVARREVGERQRVAEREGERERVINRKRQP